MYNTIAVSHDVSVDYDNNTMVGTGTAHPSGGPEYTPRLLVGFVFFSLLCIFFCGSLLVQFSFGHCIVCPLYLQILLFNATFNDITVVSWRSVLCAEETGMP